MRLELLFPFTKTTITSLKDMVRNHYHAAFGNEPKMKDVMKIVCEFDCIDNGNTVSNISAKPKLW